MSNIFKKNSRFAILSEDTSTTNKKINNNNNINNTISEDNLKNIENSINGKNNSFKKKYDDRQQYKQLNNKYINEQNEVILIEEKKIKEETEKKANCKKCLKIKHAKKHTCGMIEYEEEEEEKGIEYYHTKYSSISEAIQGEHQNNIKGIHTTIQL